MRCLTFHDYLLNVGKVKAVFADFSATSLRRPSLHRPCLDTVALVIFSKQQFLAACQSGHFVSGFPTLSSDDQFIRKTPG